jgi:pimeloyl-ACP methyl ester carboxylesterase
MWKQIRFGADQGIAGIVERPDKLDASLPLIMTFPGLGQAMSEKNYLFSNLRKRLAEERLWCVQFDYRGCGDSEGELGQTSIASMVADALQVLSDVTEEQQPSKIYLAGHALGAVIAQKVALLWEERTGIECRPILISPPLAQLPAACDVFPQCAIADLEKEGQVDSKLLVPGDDYYTLSDFDRKHYDYISVLGAHLLYLHGQFIGKSLLDELDELDPLALFNQNAHGLHILCAEQDSVNRQLAERIKQAEVLSFGHGTHFYRHPAAMDHTVELICKIVIPSKCKNCKTCSCKKHESLAQKLLSQKKVDWRFPDEYGLSERNLDCLQLSILEVLKWKGETDPIPVFLNPFDCHSGELLLRRSLPVLHRGWRLIQYPALDKERLQHLLRSVLDGEGYALVHYRAIQAPFSAYYEKHDVVHWALVIAYEEDHILLVDDAGSSVYFNGYIGKIPCSLFFDTLDAAKEGGVAILQKSAETMPWKDRLIGLLQQSVNQMTAEGGLAKLTAFVNHVEQASARKLVESLDMLEFDIHYYRRLRELWKTALERGAFPDDVPQTGCAEALHQVCQTWSYIMGVIMKWKIQRERNYRTKLIGLLRQAAQEEQQLFQTMASMLEENRL